MLHLTLSNRFEILLDRLLDRLDAEPPDPFARRQIIVPSSALRRRVELARADRTGLCANLEFSYLAQWLWARMGQVIPLAADSPFAPPRLTWRLYAWLETPAAARHPRLAGYLGGADPEMRRQLGQRLAQVFDHYITYRSDWLAHWAAGRQPGLPHLDDTGRADAVWQATLWRELLAPLSPSTEHPSAAFFRAVEAWPAHAGPPPLPERAHVFCLPSLPPLYLDILSGLAHWTEIHLYVLNPCQEYWFEIIDRKRLNTLASQGTDGYHEVGNALLADWGRQTQAHLRMLVDAAGEALEDDSHYQPAGGNTLLAALQNAILELRPPEPAPLAGHDRSLEIHVCHSLTRELEVLHDQLLSLFAADATLRPEDILVATPDLAAAAPLIDAIFGAAPAGRAIPYVITGRPQSQENPVARTLLAVLDLAGGRCPASALHDLLRQPPVAARFGLEEDALERLRDWIEAAGIRWGLDAGHRRDLGLPDDPRHSFADGLHRLFLAYAWGDPDEAADARRENGDDGADGATPGPLPLFAGRVGAGNPEGGEAQALGRFWRALESLSRTRVRLAEPADAVEWRARLRAVLADFVAPGFAWLDALRAVEERIETLAREMAEAGPDARIPLAVTQAALAEALDDPARGGVPGGAVTFAALPSLRALPYPVICLIGMNHDAFPGPDRPLEFDLMARAPRPGDRQRRLDQRNLFLDLLLAARRRFYLSYTGRTQRDGALLSPSPLVDQLLEHALQAVAGDDPAAQAEARRRLVLEHPLQAFSRVYFLAGAEHDPRLESHHGDYLEALRHALAAPRPGPAAPFTAAADADDDPVPEAPAAPFFPVPLPLPEGTSHDVELEDLVSFFRHPARTLLRHRLGLRLDRGEAELQDDEPFLPGWPERQALARRLLPALLAGRDDAALRALARAGNEYPAGRLGEALATAELARLRDFARGLADDLAQPAGAPRQAHLDFILEGEAWRLDGTLAEPRPGLLVSHRYDDARAADYLEAWIRHLFLCALPGTGEPPHSRRHARNGVIHLRPCTTAREHLAGLLALYRDGLRAPLHFYPRTAWTFVQSGRSQAEQTWRGHQHPGEGGDPDYRLALRGVAEPLDGEFERLAHAVFDPLLAHLMEQPA